MIIIMYFVAIVMICIIVAIVNFWATTEIKMKWCIFCEQKEVFIRRRFWFKFHCLSCEELKIKNKK